MTKEQIQDEYIKTLRDWNEEVDRIIKDAKENGNWEPGLDSNQELFAEVDRKYKDKIELLKKQIR